MQFPGDPNHVAVDLDDVVLDFLGGLVTAVNTEFGSDLKQADVKDWDLHEMLDPIVGRSFWKWLRDRYWLWSNFPAVPGAMGGLEALRRQGYYLECVTSKPDWAEAQVWKWMGKWRPPFHRVTIVGHDDKKADFSDALFLVDDKPQNCEEWSETGRTALLFDRPHNYLAWTGVQDNGGVIVRAMDWDQVLKALEIHKAMQEVV